MNTKYKIGDWIVFIGKEYSKRWKDLHGISLYGKVAKIIDIYNKLNIEDYVYLIKFIDSSHGNDNYWCSKNDITLYKDFYKLKKLIEG